MSNTDTIVILIAFAAYLVLMIAIGAIYMKNTNNSEDYFLGGRGLSGWVAALSAQASDMSGWLLMGLPGTVYALGTGQSWIAIGLFLGTVCNWVFISSRLRKYTIRANNSLTLPAYFENRFRDKKRVLLLVSSIVIVIFFLVYTASALSAGGKLFNSVFGVDYHVALAIGAAVILIYTFMGGFMAVCVTDFIQGSLMLVGLLVVPIAAYFMVGADQVKPILDQSSVVGGASAYLSLFRNGDRSYTAVEIVSQLAWGAGILWNAAYSDSIYGGKESERVEKIESNCYYMGNDFSGSSCSDRHYRSCLSVSDDSWNGGKCFHRKRLYRDDHKNVYERYESAIYRRNLPVRYPGSDYVHSGFAASGDGFIRV